MPENPFTQGGRSERRRDRHEPQDSTFNDWNRGDFDTADRYSYPRSDTGYFSPPRPRPGSSDQTWAVLAHVSPLVAMVVSAALLGVLGPLIIWLVRKDDSPYVRNAAAGAFNFALALWVGGIIAWILIFTFILIPVAVLIYFTIFLSQIIFSIRGVLAANRGEAYRYPFGLRVLR